MRRKLGLFDEDPQEEALIEELSHFNVQGTGRLYKHLPVFNLWRKAVSDSLNLPTGTKSGRGGWQDKKAIQSG